MNKTYDEIYEEDVEKIKYWVNNADPFDFIKHDYQGYQYWEYSELSICDAINEYVETILNPNILYKVAEQEIEKVHQYLYKKKDNLKPFETNVGTIYATYCLIGKDKIKFYDKQEQLVVCLKVTDFTFVKNDKGTHIYNHYEWR